MKLTYILLYILLISALLGCTIIAKRSSKPSRGAVAWLETSLTLPIIGNLLVLTSLNKIVVLIGFYIYFISIDVVLMALVNFTNTYCQGIGNGTHKPTVVYVGLYADMLQILMNLIFGHAFDVEAVTVDGVPTFQLVSHFGQTVHRIADYLVLICVMLLFTLASILTPRIYKEKYTVLLGAMIAIGITRRTTCSPEAAMNVPSSDTASLV